MNRWTSGGAAAVLAVAAFAAPGAAQAPAKEKLVELGKIFPYYDKYLGLPAPDRALWALSYRMNVAGKPASGVKAAYVGPQGRTPVSIGADGKISPMPTLAQWKAKHHVAVTAPEGAKIGVSMDVVPTMVPAAALDAQQLAAAAAQATRGAKKAAGPIGLAVPKFERAWFPGAAGGTVETPSGAKPLPTKGPRATPYFDPADWPGATKIRFETAPSRIVLAPAKD